MISHLLRRFRLPGRFHLLLLACLGLAALTSGEASAQPADAARSAVPGRILPGVEVLLDKFAAQLNGKRVGILTNPTGVDRNLNSTIDLVRSIPGIQVVRLFAPEHGVRGGFAAGESTDQQQRDTVSGLPIVSLHGATRRPPPETLRDLDLVIYDIQDVGSRSYTFISTLTYLMEACEQANVAVWVLDRPDPLGGDKVGGPMLDDQYKSFIGVHNVPQTYGLTPGEFALLIKRERTPKINLTVVPMLGWTRGMSYGDTGLLWVPPSEHVPNWRTSFFYAMTGILGELGIVSEGVGTPQPFELIGAPWLDGMQLARLLNAQKLPGVMFRPKTFKPRYGSHTGKMISGVQIHLTDPHRAQPADVSAAIMQALLHMYPGRDLFKSRAAGSYDMFTKAVGDKETLEALASGRGPEALEAQYAREHADYLKRRAEVLIYK